MSHAESIKARLRNLAIKTHKSFDYLLMHYFIERLLYRLSISDYAENFILKGGLLIYTMLENDARATRDVDFLAQKVENTPEELTRIFAKVCTIQWDDAVRYDPSSIRAERIKEDADYEGVRIKLVGYLDKSCHTLQFDIGYGDVIVPGALEMEYPSLLEMERPYLKVYSKESIISEKFEAMIALAELNSRMKDFYDIYTLSRIYCFDGFVLYEAIRQTLEKRNTPLVKNPVIFSKEFIQNSNKQKQWQAFQKRIQVSQDISFDEALRSIKSFLLPLYENLLNEKEFFGKWDCNKGFWK